MPWLLSLALKLGVPARFGKAAVIGAGIILLLIAAFAAVKIHDHRVIATHDAKQDAATAKADRAADNHAAEQRRTDDARLTQETTELNRSTNNGQTDLDRRLAFQRCLRMQQSARAAKRQPPACN
jgi:threonine dehydrogenase-like Zn-dependent dehydrogenase